MLGQAAAMLISFPAAVAAEVRGGTLPIGLHVGTFAGSAIAALGNGLAVLVGVARRGLASDRRFLAGTVHTARQVRTKSRGASDRSGFQSLAGPQAPTMRGTHGERCGLAAFFQGRRHRSGGIGGGSGHTLAASDAVVGIDGAERYGVSVLSWVGVGERTRERQFLGRRPHHQYLWNTSDRKWEGKKGSGSWPRH